MTNWLHWKKLSDSPSSGRSVLSDKERSLLSLPKRLGGLGLNDPRTLREKIKRSRDVTQPIIEHIIEKDNAYTREMKA